MSLWQHQGRLMYRTPNISRPATTGTNSLHLSWHVPAGVRPLFVPRESAANNLQKPAALQHYLLAASMKGTIARNTIPDRPSPGLPRTALLDLIFRRQWKNELGRRRQLQTIAQWNVRILLYREAADRPETRTALVAMELAKYNIDIAALCETRFSESGSLNDLEYSFFWSGKPKGERREAGVGFAIKKDIVTN